MLKLTDPQNNTFYISIENISAVTGPKPLDTGGLIYTVDQKQWQTKETASQIINKIEAILKN